MIYIVYRDGSWNETESDLEAAEYAQSKIWLVTIRGNESRPTPLTPDLGWVCGKCKTVNDEERLLCGFCDTPRLSG